MGAKTELLATAAAGALKIEPTVVVAGIMLAAVAAAATWLLNRPSRTFTEAGIGGTVGNEYDAWTEEGILEYYWGEHIHLGYYNETDLKAITNPMKSGKVFKDTKYKFIEEMYKWSDAERNSGGAPKSILDVGCGIGGTSRYLGNKLKDQGTQVTGISLSPKQVERATQLAKERELDNVNFKVMDALKMDFPDNSFDLVWGCESGEHMPDKAKYVEEMTRVLKPGGTLVIATWCQRELEKGQDEFTADEKKKLQFLYDEWAHPYFISIEEYERLCGKTGQLTAISGANWVKETIAAWRHSIWVGVWDPWMVIWKGFTSRMGPRVWWKTIREIVTLERMHRAFDCGLMTYGMIKAKKLA
jgi:MPBQ/MSBQ methyltransferase